MIAVFIVKARGDYVSSTLLSSQAGQSGVIGSVGQF
jgi:hypothetical protein